MNMAVHTPKTSDEQIEDEIQRKSKTAPRITPADIEAAIERAYYFTAAEGVFGAAIERTMNAGGVIAWGDEEAPHSATKLLTFCVLVLRNGFTVTGESACASPENFDAEIGRKIARQNAVAKIWPLEGYLLKQHLHDGPTERSDLGADFDPTASAHERLHGGK
ncbi:hypothetical protein IAG25_35535 [Caballeronia sp. EK]|uniref:Gp49 family protein n=1 Tax=Caballeronia sp. EK TaxID=2767469 RepID=UPI0016565B46|nr:Gp49 family protein [Caballeronia sp. EK]MBC8642120.1 hypothetical protein [Caballeronia sp. EK]